MKDLVLVKMNESFALGDDDILRYQDRQCVTRCGCFVDQDH